MSCSTCTNMLLQKKDSRFVSKYHLAIPPSDRISRRETDSRQAESKPYESRVGAVSEVIYRRVDAVSLVVLVAHAVGAASWKSILILALNL